MYVNDYGYMAVVNKSVAEQSITHGPTFQRNIYSFQSYSTDKSYIRDVLSVQVRIDLEGHNPYCQIY